MFLQRRSTIYLDNAASTQPLKVACDRLQELNCKTFGNPSSAHKFGREAMDVLHQSCESVGRYFRVPPNHVVFTSGGTESNNLAIWGALGGLTQAIKWLKTNPDSQVMTSTIEHPATAKVFECLEECGAKVAWLNVDEEGLIRTHDLETALQNRTKLLSIHHAQNEIGVVQDIASITRAVRQKHPDCLIHIDAIQSFMKIPLDFEELGVDMISISAHKVGGPKGIGALILGPRFEKRTPKLGAFINGSSQQFGIRPGTIPVPLIGSFTAAIEWGIQNFELNTRKVLALRSRLVSKLPKSAVINGPKDTSEGNPRRAPQTLNFSIPGTHSAVVVEALTAKGFCVSAGSACHSTSPQPNFTLGKMGVPSERSLSSIRVSFSSSNTNDDVDSFIDALEEVIKTTIS